MMKILLLILVFISNCLVANAATFTTVKVGDSSPINSSALLEIKGTTGTFLLPRMTTAQKNLISAVNGDMVYDSTVNAMSMYQAGAWVNLSASGGSGITSLNGLGGAAQLFGNDSNVTIVSGGTTHQLTWQGVLPLNRGGTNASLPATNGAVIYSTATGLTITTVGTSGQILKSNGAGAPTWTANSSGITSLNNLTGSAQGFGNDTNMTIVSGGTTHTLTWAGLLGLSRGGTNANLSAVNGTVAYSNASSLALTALGTSGQVLTSQGGSTPTWTTPSASNGITSLNNLTGAAQAFGNDTNVTVVSGGTTHQVTWAGLLALNRGGTNANLTASNGAVPYSTSTAIALTTVGTNGQVLTSSGAGAPTWQTASSSGITSLNNLTGAAQSFGNDTNMTIISGGTTHTLTWAGLLGLSRGGSNANLTASNGAVTYSDASKLQLTTVGTSGQILSSNGAGAPTWTTDQQGITSLNNITGAAQAFGNDANVTIVTGGTTHVLTWAGFLALNRGGTNANITAANGGVAYSTASAIALTTVGTSGQILTSGGASTPNWTSVLPLVNGGTNASLPATNGAVIYSTATGLTVTTVGTSGQILKSNGASAPTWTTDTTGITSLNNLTGSAQAFTNDTNMTIVSGGTTHTLTWAGLLALNRGGTNANNTAANGAVAYSNASSIALSAVGTSGQILSSSGAGTPTWTQAPITSLNNITSAAQAFGNDTNVTIVTGGTTHTITWAGLLGLTRGGTNANLTAANGAVTYSTASALALTTVGTSNQVLTSNGAGAPTWQATQVTGITSLNNITGAAQAFGNDTNVTIVTGGTTHTLTWAGLLGLSRGGTNANLTASNGALAYSDASKIQLSTVGTSGQFLTSAGAAAPTWSSVLPLVNGGTNASLPATNGAVIYSTATGLTVTTVGTSGQILKSNGAGAPTWTTDSTGITSLNNLTGAAQGFGNDTNVTVVSGGTTHTLTWAGLLGLNRGGTNANITASAGTVVYSGASALALTSIGTTGQLLTSQGGGTPTWTTAGAGSGITSLNNLTGPAQAFGNDTNVTIVSGGTTHTVTWAGLLGLSRGGTNANLVASNGAVHYSTASATALTSVGTSGQVLTSSGAGTPTWASAMAMGGIITGGTVSSIPFVNTGSTVWQDGLLTWDNTNKMLQVPNIVSGSTTGLSLTLEPNDFDTTGTINLNGRIKVFSSQPTHNADENVILYNPTFNITSTGSDGHDFLDYSPTVNVNLTGSGIVAQRGFNLAPNVTFNSGLSYIYNGLSHAGTFTSTGTPSFANTFQLFIGSPTLTSSTATVTPIPITGVFAAAPSFTAGNVDTTGSTVSTFSQGFKHATGASVTGSSSKMLLTSIAGLVDTPVFSSNTSGATLNITERVGVDIVDPAYTSTGNINLPDNIGFRFKNQSVSSGNRTVNRIKGLSLSQNTGASVTYNIFEDGTSPNVFTGGVRVGDTVTPTDKLEVNGNVVVGYPANTTGILKFANANNSNIVGLRAGISSGTTTWNLPLVDGSANQVIITDGNGSLSFANAPAGGRVMKTRTTTQTVTNSAALVDDDTLSGFTLATGTYEVKGMIDFKETSTTADCKIAFVSSSTNTNFSISVLGIKNGITAISSLTAAYLTSSGGTADVAMPTANTDYEVNINGSIAVVGAGNFKLQFAQQTATAATNCQIQIGSFLVLTPQ